MAPGTDKPQPLSRPIRLRGVRQNNLKNLSVEFPPKRISVVTGLSGSGKSSLVFDTLYAEGQRRYVESLSTYTRQFLDKMPKPDVDQVENIPPAIALEQRNHVVNSRSTVGTQTEIIDYLRVLFAKVGHTFCIDCGTEVKHQTPSSILEFALEWLPGRKALIVAPLFASAPSEASEAKSKGKAKTPKAPTLGSLAQILKSQGFTRVLHRNRGKSHLLEVEEMESLPSARLAALQKEGELYAVIDRLKLPSSKSGDPGVGSDLRGRLLDSIDQAAAIGRGKVGFADLETSGTQSWRLFDQHFACGNCGREHRPPEPHLFSFNSPVGACPRCSGFGHTLDLDEALVVPDPSQTLKNGAIDPFSKPSFADWQKDLFRFAERHGISIGKRYRDLTALERRLLWQGDPQDKTFPGIIACFEELKRWKYKLHIRVFVRRYQNQTLCLHCEGARLVPDALAVKIGGLHIAQVQNLPIHEALRWLESLSLSASETKIASDILAQISRRLSLLAQVGVGYLTLARLAKTLSGGEFQRINLATQLGNGLCGTLYVLDEPSIGLHAADTERLLGVLTQLRDQGNTVVVVEHDLEVMKAADWLVELGPGAGSRGGELIAQGDAHTLQGVPASVTGKYLSGDFVLRRELSPRPPARRSIRIKGCREHNLKNIEVTFPLDRFVVVTGMSGSGKSTLVHRTLSQALSKQFYKSTEDVGAYDQLYGSDQIRGVVLLDQSSIGKSSRSNPATYLKAWDEVRRIYAGQVLAIKRGYTPQHFSFNVDGGRCPVCKGEGEITLDMHFMAEVKLPCEECEGRRFKKPVLEVLYRGKNIHQLLHTTIDDAFDLFRDNPTLHRKLGILRDVGLGYLQLGQSGTTLSGGESQRLKIAASLDDQSAENLLYIFDEPTTGLHLEDIKKLLRVINDLVDARNSVIMIEHHLDVIAQADWVIDLGPGGGKDGGQIIAQGPPEDIVRTPHSATGRMLRKAGYFPDSART